MHPRISLSGVTTEQWGLAQDIDLCQVEGVGQLGVPMSKIDEIGLGEAKRLMADSGLRPSYVLLPTAFRLTEPETWDDARRKFEQAIDAALDLGSELMYFTGGPPGRLLTDEACRAFGDAIAPVVRYGQQVGVRLALEPNHALRRDIGFLHSLRDALPVAESTGIDLCVELNNCWIESQLSDTFNRGVARFALVQVSDFVIGTLDTPNRAVPGDGDIPLEELIVMLLAAGYSGCFDLELVGPRINLEGIESAVHRGLRWLDDLLVRIDPSV